MKRLILVLMAVALSGCASVSVEYSDAEGFKGTSRTLFKDVEDFNATWGDVDVSLGASQNAIDQRLIACALAPELCQ